MSDTFHTQNNATNVTPTAAGTGAAPIDPKETGSRGKPPGQPEAGVEKPGPGGTLPDKKPFDPLAEEYDDPDGSLDAFD
jgi:hypothetical protein